MTQNEDQPAADGQRELRLEEELSELSELSDQPGPVEGYSAARVETVWRAVKDWTRQLIDLGGRNNLLHYRDLKTGTLDLTKAEASTLEKLLASKSVRLSSLYPDDESREQALRRARTIHKKEKENFEERGIDTLHLACGLATWENKKTAWAPLAPVLLRQATLKPIGASQEDFELSLVEEAEVNQTLVQALKRDFDCHVEEDELLEHVDGPIDEWWELDAAYKWIEGQASRVPEFNVTPRLVLANFVYAKLPMVKDLEGALEELVAHDLIAAIAGDEKAKEAVRLSMPKPEDVPAPDQVPFEDEFLILDADASQTYAINAVLAGASLIVRGPPGTGKSQTIANLVGSLVAHGKKVLFVAEKRAAIDAVLKRLRQRKLDNLVLDLHGRITSRRAFAETIGRALASSRTAGRVENKDDLRRLEKLRTELNNHLEALHAKREPWGISVFDIRTELMKVAEGQRDLRFGKDVLSGLSGDTNASAEEDLAEYAALGGTTLRSGDSPWADSHITRQEDVQEANSLVESLRRDLMPAILGSLADASVAAGLPQATSLDDWKPRLALSNKIDRMLDSFESGIYELEFDEFTQSLSPAQKGGLARISASDILYGIQERTSRGKSSLQAQPEPQ